MFRTQQLSIASFQVESGASTTPGTWDGEDSGHAFNDYTDGNAGYDTYGMQSMPNYRQM